MAGPKDGCPGPRPSSLGDTNPNPCPNCRPESRPTGSSGCSPATSAPAPNSDSPDPQPDPAMPNRVLRSGSMRVLLAAIPMPQRARLADSRTAADRDGTRRIGAPRQGIGLPDHPLRVQVLLARHKVKASRDGPRALPDQDVDENSDELYRRPDHEQSEQHPDDPAPQRPPLVLQRLHGSSMHLCPGRRDIPRRGVHLGPYRRPRDAYPWAVMPAPAYRNCHCDILPRGARFAV